MKPLQTLIVDDEPIARQVLREELEAMPAVELVGEASNGVEALKAITARQPDLVFLDLQMPDMGGFEVVRNLEGQRLPYIVIVTAFDQHAIRAFEAGAVDYLLKPVGQDRLQRSVERVLKLHSGTPGQAPTQTAALQQVAASLSPSPPSKILGKLGEEFHILELDQILAFQAEREIVWIVTGKRRYMATSALKDIETRLAGSSFVRVHRNALVNLNHVAKMAPLSSQRWLLTLSGGQEFVVSKRQAKAVEQLLQL